MEASIRLSTSPPDDVNTWTSILKKSENLAYKIADISDCVEERIAFCGAVQPFGLLIVADAMTFRILAMSKNVADALNIESEQEFLNQTFDKILRIQTKLAQWSCADLCKLTYSADFNIELQGSEKTAFTFNTCYLQGPNIVFEFEEANSNSNDNPMELVSRMVTALKDSLTPEDVCERMTSIVREFTDFDRIMAYRFDEIGNGEVVAEGKSASLPPFLGLKYPASDIPQQARDLFLKNQTRIIYDTRVQAIPIVTHELSLSHLDLSECILRAVSPIHLQYLENMGVVSTFTVPIKVNEKLWGLLVCHHYGEPKRPSRTSRFAFDVLSKMVAGRIAELVSLRRMQIKNSTLEFTQSLLNDVASGKEVFESFVAAGDSLLAMTSSSSAYVRLGTQELFVGDPIAPDTLAAINQKLQNQDKLSIWMSECLFRDLELKIPNPHAAGALAIPFSLGFKDVLIWFRKAESYDVRWGGEPKPGGRSEQTQMSRLTPRASFAEWSEKVENRCRPWTDGDDECAQYFLFGFVQEIFIRAQALAVAYKELEKLIRAKDDFVSTVSHELRTPLGVIIGWVDILKDGIHSRETERAIGIIERNARIQVALIDDLLDVSRIVSGKMRIDVRANVDVSELISGVVESLGPGANAKGIHVHWKTDKPTIANVDPDRLRQMLWNLVSNSLKFTPKGGSIWIRAIASRSAVLIEVEDNGVGIDQASQKHIFDRFVQENSAAVSKGGLGLGLSIVKGLTELHGGRIEVSSLGRDQGSKFSITLPNYLMKNELPVTEHAKPAPATGRAFANLRILLAEDSLDASEAMKIYFKRDGAAKVVTALNGFEALDLLAHSSFDIILSDIGMPELDGYGFIKAWRIEEKRRGLKPIPAIALTAYATPKDRAKTLEAGFTDHLSKPVDRNELRAVVSKSISVVGSAIKKE